MLTETGSVGYEPGNESEAKESLNFEQVQARFNPRAEVEDVDPEFAEKLGREPELILEKINGIGSTWYDRLSAKASETTAKIDNRELMQEEFANLAGLLRGFRDVSGPQGRQKLDIDGLWRDFQAKYDQLSPNDQEILTRVAAMVNSIVKGLVRNGLSDNFGVGRGYTAVGKPREYNAHYNLETAKLLAVDESDLDNLAPRQRANTILGDFARYINDGSTDYQLETRSPRLTGESLDAQVLKND